MNNKRLTYSYVKEFIESIGYKLLNSEYKNNLTKLDVICNKGHQYKVSYNSIQQGNHCPCCRIESTYNYVKNYIESVDGYELLSDKYLNTETPLEIRCPNGHISKPTFGNFKSGHRCKYCSGNVKLDIVSVKNLIESEGYKLLSNEYVNARSKLCIQCPKDHIYKTRYYQWYNLKQRCPYCAGNVKLSYEYIKKEVEDVGYKLISEKYINNNSCLVVQCDYDHVFSTNFNRFKQGKCRCKICVGNGRSQPERDLVDFIKTFYDGVLIENDKTLVKNYLTNRFLELDVWLPDINKAIEFNGEYYHSSDKTKVKDKIKIDTCKKLNIYLLVIKYKDWINDQLQVEQNIKNFIIGGN